MKRNNIKKHISGFLACVLLAGCVWVLPTEAGSSNLVVDSNSYKTELDTSLWNTTDSKVFAKDGLLVFSEESKSSTAIITKTVAKNTGYHDELVSLEATMNLSGIPAGETFVAALGLASIESMMGESGNVEIQFTNDGGLKVTVVVYDLDGKKIEFSTPVSVSSATNVKLKATISADAILNLSVNGRQICNDKLPVEGEGRVGFLQTGSCAVTLKDVKMVAHRYDRPENCDVYEDFEQESMNVNTLTAKMVYVTGHYVPYGMEIQENPGNRVMEFKNLSLAYLGTMYQYSNFELTFDVVGMQRVTETDEQGNVIVPKNEYIVVSFGDEAADYDDFGYETSPDAVVFTGDSQVYSMNLGYLEKAEAKGYDFGDAKCTKDFTVRVSVIDGIVTTSMKWVNEENFTEILKYKVSDATPLGYVHIWASGLYTNFSVDNVSIVNKDTDPNLIEVEYKSGLITAPEDFVYEKIGYVYRDTEAEEAEESFNHYLLIPIVAVVCMAIFGTVFVITKKKVKRRLM